MTLFPFKLNVHEHFNFLQESFCNSKLCYYSAPPSGNTRQLPLVNNADQMYWAKGTGFGTGSTASNWDIEKALKNKKKKEKNIVIILQVYFFNYLSSECLFYVEIICCVDFYCEVFWFTTRTQGLYKETSKFSKEEINNTVGGD